MENPHRADRPRPRGVPLALAGLALALGLFVVVALVRASNTDSRGAGMEEIASPVPPRLPRGAFVLRWTPGPPGTLYDIRVQTPAFEPLATAANLPRAEYRVDAAALAAVPRGGRVLWSVTARRPAGRVVESRPFSTEVE